MPSSPLESCARSLQHAVREPSDPASSVGPPGRDGGREGGRGADERQKEQQIEGERERERGGGVGREECRPRSNPSGMCSARQRVPEVTDKSRPHLCPMSDGPQRENEFYGGNKKKKEKCQQTV